MYVFVYSWCCYFSFCDYLGPGRSSCQWFANACVCCQPWDLAALAGSQPWDAAALAGNQPWDVAALAGNQPWDLAASALAGSLPWDAALPWEAAEAAGSRCHAASHRDDALPLAASGRTQPAHHHGCNSSVPKTVRACNESEWAAQCNKCWSICIIHVRHNLHGCNLN